MTDAKLTARSLRDQLAYLMERTLGRLPEKQRNLVLAHMEVAVVAYARKAQIDMRERCREAWCSGCECDADAIEPRDVPPSGSAAPPAPEMK
jgi:ferredoxin